jgi:CsoR family transcriptional regulator, copper-sensing transcriptional repressor
MKSEQALERMRNIEGHIRGIEKMMEEDAYCIDVIRQIQAVQAALNKVNGMVLENHMNSCLITAIKGDDPEERQRVLREVNDIFMTSQKI